MSQLHDQQAVLPPPTCGVVASIHDGGSLGTFYRLLPNCPKPAAGWPTALFYHGWGSSAARQLSRGMTIASYGLQVILPDAIGHGSRGYLPDDQQSMVEHFWQVVSTSQREFPQWKARLVETFAADQRRLGVMGHSMGGFTAAGLMYLDQTIGCAVIYNGSFHYRQSDQTMAASLAPEVLATLGEDARSPFDPMADLSRLVDRPIFMANGGSDSIVPVAGQAGFYAAIQPQYADPNRICHRIYDGVGHFISDGMLFEGCGFLREHLVFPAENGSDLN